MSFTLLSSDWFVGTSKNTDSCNYDSCSLEAVSLRDLAGRGGGGVSGVGKVGAVGNVRGDRRAAAQPTVAATAAA